MFAGGDTLNVAIEISPTGMSLAGDTLSGEYYDLIRKLCREHGVPVKFHPFTRPEDAVEWLHEQGYRVLAVEQCEGSTMLQDFQADPNGKYAIVMGNEVKGVQQQVVDMCDGCLEIPQFGTKHSMNVSVTAGMVIWTIFARSLPGAQPAR